MPTPPATPLPAVSANTLVSPLTALPSNRTCTWLISAGQFFSRRVKRVAEAVLPLPARALCDRVPSGTFSGLTSGWQAEESIRPVTLMLALSARAAAGSSNASPAAIRGLKRVMRFSRFTGR
ncbi:hypothetical protein D3C78_1077330 [compost metagenome]